MWKSRYTTYFVKGENRLPLLQLCLLNKEWQNSLGLELLWCFVTLNSSFMTQHFNFIAISISKLLMSSQSNMIYQRTTMTKNVKVVWYAEDDETEESHLRQPRDPWWEHVTSKSLTFLLNHYTKQFLNQIISVI